MGSLALVVAFIALVLAILPLVYTQILAVVVGLGAVLLAYVARRQATALGHSRRSSTIALAVGAVAVLLGALLYGVFTAGGGAGRDAVLRRVGKEFKGGDAQGNEEFRQAMERAIERARERQEQGQPAGQDNR